VSAYALKNDYAVEALTSFAAIRAWLRRSQDVLSSDNAADWSSLARPLKYPWDHAAHPVRRDHRDKGR
jgi:hypothetical protein